MSHYKKGAKIGGWILAGVIVGLFGYYLFQTASTQAIDLNQEQAQSVCGVNANAGEYRFSYSSDGDNSAEALLYCGKYFTQQVNLIDYPQIVLQAVQAVKKANPGSSATDMFGQVYGIVATSVDFKTSFAMTDKYYTKLNNLNINWVDAGYMNDKDNTPMVDLNSGLGQAFSDCTDKSLPSTQINVVKNFLAVSMAGDQTEISQPIYQQKVDNLINCIINDKKSFEALNQQQSNANTWK